MVRSDRLNFRMGSGNTNQNIGFYPKSLRLSSSILCAVDDSHLCMQKEHLYARNMSLLLEMNNWGPRTIPCGIPMLNLYKKTARKLWNLTKLRVDLTMFLLSLVFLFIIKLRFPENKSIKNYITAHTYVGLKTGLVFRCIIAIITNNLL